MSDDVLYKKAREALRTGRLPNRMPDRSWGGKGLGATCRICGATIDHDELEFELEFHNEAAAIRRCYVHVRCFHAWAYERRRFGTRSTSDTALASGEVDSPALSRRHTDASP